MLDQLERVEKRYQELNRQIAMPEVASDLKQLQTLAQERASIESLMKGEPIGDITTIENPDSVEELKKLVGYKGTG